MGRLTTHVLDTLHGTPAGGLRVTLHRLDDEGGAMLLRDLALDGDGRCADPLLEGEAFTCGRYRLVFELGAYFRARGVVLPQPPFLERVPIEFAVADTGPHLHVPLLAGPWSYTTYRGS